jgi:phosphoserine aminotransferase
MPITPMIWDWAKEEAMQSMLNTPPTFAIYLSGLVFKWLLKRGGVAEMERVNLEKSTLLYNYIDQSDF